MNEYPALHYPELYVLKGGYRDFFHAAKVCDDGPQCRKVYAGDKMRSRPETPVALPCGSGSQICCTLL